ncbi:MAG TPA: shikimate dehydrogenase [Aliidongia sp.]|uniref:shikimate dehydrogenase family protein n=1 Tax=Aliidongia sp. TaxID=1914230 RepID=UPI002DDD2926|nr:shikimate dehydrogenase [Aliidongia sp.]HEV2675540.1 shikimate dehydrogenase [Aliidongia sp.]
MVQSPQGEAFRVPCPSGATRLFAVIGHPVAQVQAPALMNRLFVDRMVDAVLVPIEVAPADFPVMIEGLKRIANLDGILVTVPYKFVACDHADHLDEAARLAGSANALRREADGSWTADNFDGVGFVQGLVGAGHDPREKVVSLVGAGGAGTSIAPALLACGARLLVLSDVSAERAMQLAGRLEVEWPRRVRVASAPAAAESDILINATPVGLRAEDPLPFGLDGVRADAVVADIIMKPAETRLLKAALARGLRVHPGIHMLSEQIELYRRFFRIP